MAVPNYCTNVDACAALRRLARPARAEGNQELVAKVDPAVVQVNVGKDSLGSGVVVDAEKGLIATNYHVIEHASEKEVSVSFPADKEKKSYPAEGFVGIMPGKDLALIRIKPGEGNFKP